MESIFCAELSPSKASCILADNIIKSLANQPPAYASYDFLVAQTRYLNGKELSDCMQLPETSFYSKLLVFAQCFFFTTMCYLHRSFDFLDRRKIGLVKRVFYSVIVEGKAGLQGETTFGLNYVPQYGLITEPGKFTAEMHVRHRGVEGRNAKVLALFAGVMLLSMWASIQLLR